MDEGQCQLPQDCRTHMDGKVRGAAAQMSEMGGVSGRGLCPRAGLSLPHSSKFPAHPVLAGAVQAEAVPERVCGPLLCLPH